MKTITRSIVASGYTFNPNYPEAHARNLAVLQRGASTLLAMTCANYSHGRGIEMGERLVSALASWHRSGVTPSCDEAGDFLFDTAMKQADVYCISPGLSDDTGFNVFYLQIDGDRADALWCGGIAALLIRDRRIEAFTLPHYVGETTCCFHLDRRQVYSDPHARAQTRFFGRPRSQSRRGPPLDRMGVRWRLLPGDEIAIMSDDVWETCWDDLLPDMLTGDADVDVKKLVDAALADGARGDVSAIVATIHDSDDPEPRRAPHG